MYATGLLIYQFYDVMYIFHKTYLALNHHDDDLKSLLLQSHSYRNRILQACLYEVWFSFLKEYEVWFSIQ
jgi:hypothetical protein